jgi:hypothetical protein
MLIATCCALVMAGAGAFCERAEAYSDVLTGLASEVPGKCPYELTMSHKMKFHSDTFAVTGLLTKGGGASLWSPADGGWASWDVIDPTKTIPYWYLPPAPVVYTYDDGAPASGAYFVLADGRKDPAADAVNEDEGRNTCASRVVSFGGGNDTGISTWSYVATPGDTDTGLVVDTNSKIVLGNGATRSEALIAGSPDAEFAGYALGFDTLTGTMVPDLSTPDPDDLIPNPADFFVVPAKMFVDANDDSMITFDTLYDFDVDEAGGLYYDRNRDGEVHDVLMNADEVDADKSDRPFIAVYETDDGTLAPLNNPSGIDADGDGREVDDYWVGNPFAPVDADAVDHCRGTDGGTGPEAEYDSPAHDPYDLTSTGTLGEPLFVGEPAHFKVRNLVDMTPPAGQGQQLYVEHTGEYDLQVTDGRLYDYYVDNGAVPTSIKGIWNASFTYDFGNPDLTRYMEWTDDGTVHLYSTPVPEPAGALLLLGSLAGLAVRRRRS